MPENEAQMSAEQHAQRIAQMLEQAQQECRADIGRIEDPKAQALFETIAEVLGGAMKALTDYQDKNESVWQSHPSKARGRNAGKQCQSTNALRLKDHSRQL